MNHFDDRASYFAHLQEQPGGRFDCLDANKQADQSLSAYGCKAGTVQVSDLRAEV